MPTLYVSGGYEYAENRYMVHQDNWSAIAGVNINLFSGGLSSSKSGVARAELRSLRLSREKLLDGIRMEVKSAYLDLQSSGKKIEVARPRSPRPRRTSGSSNSGIRKASPLPPRSWMPLLC